MIEADRFYWSKDVAELLFARHITWFYDHRSRLESEEGFPPPISRIGRARWSGRALLAWRDRPVTAGAPTSRTEGEPARPAEPKPEPVPDYANIVRMRLAQASWHKKGTAA
jgi:hypothetical protein